MAGLKSIEIFLKLIILFMRLQLHYIVCSIVCCFMYISICQYLHKEKDNFRKPVLRPISKFLPLEIFKKDQTDICQPQSYLQEWGRFRDIPRFSVSFSMISKIYLQRYYLNAFLLHLFPSALSFYFLSLSPRLDSHILYVCMAILLTNTQKPETNKSL